MATIFQVNQNIQALRLRSEVPKIIEETKDAIADAQVEQQISGKRSDDTDITPDYKDSTIAIKEAKGQITDRVTLGDTESFHQKTEVYVKQDRFEITSTDEKTASLEKKYGRKIFGLNRQYLEDYGRDVFRPRLKKYVEDTSKLTMK